MSRIVLIDDHALFRAGMRALLSAADDLEVVGEAGTARDGALIVRDQKPDLAVVDVTLPDGSGITAVSEILHVPSPPRVLVLTMHVTVDVALDALSAGANGVALKEQPAEEIVQAMRAVANGGTYLAPRFPPWLLDPKRRSHVAHPLAPLSAREREIFDLVVRGHTNESIGQRLFISVKTVETHRARINRKLGAHSSADLVRFASRHGLMRE